MVVPIRDLGNITQSPTIMSFNSLDLVHRQNIDMVVNPIGAMFGLDYNYDKMRGHSLDMSVYRPRSPSMLLSKCNEEYHIRVKHESNRMVENKPINSSGSFSLEYTTQEGQNHQSSKATNPTLNMRQQCALTVGPALTHSPSKNAVNV